MAQTFYKEVIIIDESLEDGRLTQKNSTDENLNLRAAAMMSRRLGRALTDTELALFKDSPQVGRNTVATV